MSASGRASCRVSCRRTYLRNDENRIPSLHTTHGRDALAAGLNDRVALALNMRFNDRVNSLLADDLPLVPLVRFNRRPANSEIRSQLGAID